MKRKRKELICESAIFCKIVNILAGVDVHGPSVFFLALPCVFVDGGAVNQNRHSLPSIFADVRMSDIDSVVDVTCHNGS